MKYFWYSKTLTGVWASYAANEAPSPTATDGTKRLPMSKVYDLVKETELGGLGGDMTTWSFNDLRRYFPPPEDGSAPADLPKKPLPPLPPAEVPLAPPIIPEVPVDSLTPFIPIWDLARPLVDAQTIKRLYVNFVQARLLETSPLLRETHAALWKMKMSEGFRAISEIQPGADLDHHIARAAQLIPNWIEDFRSFQNADMEIV